jgi:methyl-accepting chemotaxis protein
MLKQLLANLSIATKLNTASVLFSLTVALSMLFILLSVNSTSEISEQQSAYVAQQQASIAEQAKMLQQQQMENERVSAINQIDREFRTMRAWLLDLSVSWLNEAESNSEESQQRLKQLLEQLAKSDSQLATELVKKSEDFYQLMIEAVDAYVDENRVKGNALIAKGRLQANDIEQLLGNYSQQRASSVEQVNRQAIAAGEAVIKSAEKVKLSSDAIVSKNSDLFNVSITVLLLVILLSIAFSIILRREICIPIERLRSTVANIQENADLRVRFEVRSMDEIGITGTAFNQMMEQFAEILRQVSRACLELDDAISHLVELMQDTKKGVVSQEQATEQVATAMNQMTVTVQEVASHTETASRSAAQAKHDAEEGRRVVDNSVKATQGLSELLDESNNAIFRVEQDSSKIGTVLDVIRSISEQTNLLALNAAIEAARAGEAGRGFAVVADEVRTLAQRTQSSTEEINAMISRLQEGTHKAVNLMAKGNADIDVVAAQASEAGDSLLKIERQVSEINDLNMLIATSTEEQAAVAESINHNIVNISDNSAAMTKAVEETTSAGERLLALSHSLAEQVQKFKV